MCARIYRDVLGFASFGGGGSPLICIIFAASSNEYFNQKITLSTNEFPRTTRTGRREERNRGKCKEMVELYVISLITSCMNRKQTTVCN